MLAIAGQTTGPNKLYFFEGTHCCPGCNIGQTNFDIFFFKKLFFLNKIFFTFKIQIFFHEQHRAFQNFVELLVP